MFLNSAITTCFILVDVTQTPLSYYKCLNFDNTSIGNWIYCNFIKAFLNILSLSLCVMKITSQTCENRNYKTNFLTLRSNVLWEPRSLLFRKNWDTLLPWLLLPIVKILYPCLCQCGFFTTYNSLVLGINTLFRYRYFSIPRFDTKFRYQYFSIPRFDTKFKYRYFSIPDHDTCFKNQYFFDTSFRYQIQVSILFDTRPRYLF